MEGSNPYQISDTLEGVVERLTFHAAESGYTVARFKPPRARELVTIVGNFAHIEPGQTLQLQGQWRSHPKYGEQFQVTQYHEMKPATLTGIEKYLGSGLIKGIGPVMAKRIVSHFGLETLTVIEEDVERLHEVPGIGDRRIATICKAWETQKAIKAVMLFLQGHGVSTTYAVKIYKQYGNDAIAVVSNNPYQLATDVYGIGFITADQIARNLGIAPHSEYRYRSGLLHVLNMAGDEGHCFLPRATLLDRGVACLKLPDHDPTPDQVNFIIQTMSLEGQLYLDSDPAINPTQAPCYAPSFFHAEYNLASSLRALISHPVMTNLERVKTWLQRAMKKNQSQLSDTQQQAVVMAAQSRLLVLTGGPGTGKTFTIKAIVALWKAMGKSILLASPTGRAAQRLAEMTSCEAKTLHRLLEFDPKTMSFKRNADNPLEADAVVVDEVSMLDVFLANNLFKAIVPTAQVLLVGDRDQLPSVGAGSVLHDLIASGQVPVVALSEVFRQAQTSQIVMNAHRINQGQFPRLESVSEDPHSDCLWLNAPNPEAGLNALGDIVGKLIPALGRDARREVQVLCPMMRGTIGTRTLNPLFQELLNPPDSMKPELKRGSTILRLGDRVIQNINDYDRDVFNGDVGEVVGIDLEEQAVEVRYEDRRVTYDYADLNEIALAWAITIHKSQGSEYPIIILPLFMSHYLMLTRNLVYTGLTRAKSLAILVGQQKALGIAVRQVKDKERFTRLAERLKLNAQKTLTDSSTATAY